VVTDAFGQNLEFGVPMVFIAGHLFKFGNQNLGDMMLLVSLIHNSFFVLDVLPDRWIEQFFFDRRVDLEGHQGFGNDLSFCRGTIGLFKPFK
jgi:hypothetical protein